MSSTTHIHIQRQRAKGQRGVSLFVVLVMVLLTSLMLLWAARTALFNELVTGNDSDYQRAMEAAHAMVRDAELDIMGTRADGQPCGTPSVSYCRPLGVVANIDIPNKKLYFPPSNDKGDSDSDLEYLKTQIGGNIPSCLAAICVGSNFLPEFWKSTSATMGLAKMLPLGASYGQYTGAAVAAVGNPSLANPETRYWVEPIQFQSNGSAASRQFTPGGGDASATASGVVYRITAVARGVKPSTLAVVQTIFVRREPSGI